jgi:glycosyltransferase involved in cell wall biosynthesis
MASDNPDRITVAVVGDQLSVHIRRWSDALIGQGFDVFPIDLARHGRPAPVAALDVVRARRSLGRLARRPRTIVAVHYVHGGLIATAMRGLHPIVLHAWGHDVAAIRSGPLGRLYGWQERALFRHADAVTATGKYLAQLTRDRFGVDATVVPFGVDTALFRPAPAGEPATPAGEPAAPPGSERTPVRVGFVKWLQARYGPQDLIEALGLLTDLQFEATLVGDGPSRASLEARVVELGLTEHVHFLGSRPHSQIPDLMRGFDIFVMPSHEEGWGVAAAEASATGIPVVATRFGGIPEIVVDGQTGLLVPPSDPPALAAAIRRLAGDADLRLALGLAGRARVEELFSWQHCVGLMETVYRDVAGRASSR